ncbi:hypothetical protein N1027_10630 [Herbiconiux sp. CPCC 205763]|uniref:LTD domain-containing protein n=1 Tax=Herbiconiux aconitum TaxID=2970913 RepID=A0ABT2GQU0_9MICO|nr:hypothetical protein [Herbiconiux aconitum]MCS5718588.1 hypothetical protein [Herbiconiux aconitum]
MIVTNVGDASTQIVDAYWELAQPDGSELRVRRSDAPGGIIEVATEPGYLVLDGVRDPAVPYSIGRNGHVQWVFTRGVDTSPAIAHFDRGRPVVEYVTRVRRRKGKSSTVTAVGDWQTRSLVPSWSAAEGRSGADEPRRASVPGADASID